MTTDDPATPAGAAPVRKQPPDSRGPRPGAHGVPTAVPATTARDEAPLPGGTYARPPGAELVPVRAAHPDGAFPGEAPASRTAHPDGVHPAGAAGPTGRVDGTYTPLPGAVGPLRSGSGRAAADGAAPPDLPRAEAGYGRTAPAGAEAAPRSAGTPPAGTAPDDMEPSVPGGSAAPFRPSDPGDPFGPSVPGSLPGPGSPTAPTAPGAPNAVAEAVLAEAALAETAGTDPDPTLDAGTGTARHAGTGADTGGGDGDEAEDGDERIRTLIWTAATYRPLEEVAALVTQLKHTKAVDSPADEALRAAAVARPLEEVRRLVAMLNEAGHTLDENDTTLRAAAVGRPIEDVVELVSILGDADGPVPPRPDTAAPGSPDAGAVDGSAQPVPEDPRVRPPRSLSTGISAPAPARETPVRVLTPESVGEGTVPASRSALRWPAAAALFACGLLHLPTDFAALWSGGYAHAMALVVAVLCLVLGEWLIVRDTVRVWGSSAALSIGVVALHGMTGSSGVALLQSSLGRSWTWSGAAAVTCAMLAALLAGSALLHRQREAGAADGT
ncbi:hypothetical protein [Streptomyces somaliensis]|nr:hypothetical protein [Streptomyces somaliensis]